MRHLVNIINEYVIFLVNGSFWLMAIKKLLMAGLIGRLEMGENSHGLRSMVWYHRLLDCTSSSYKIGSQAKSSPKVAV